MISNNTIYGSKLEAKQSNTASFNNIRTALIAIHAKNNKMWNTINISTQLQFDCLISNIPEAPSSRVPL